MFGYSISRRVWKAIRAKIAQAQREFNAAVIRFEKEREEAIKQAEVNCENQKLALADQLVKNIIG